MRISIYKTEGPLCKVYCCLISANTNKLELDILMLLKTTVVKRKLYKHTHTQNTRCKKLNGKN